LIYDLPNEDLTITRTSDRHASPAISEVPMTNRDADKDAGKKLLQLGHDGSSDYTSLAFRMHEKMR
jgi:hypothetical protein